MKLLLDTHVMLWAATDPDRLDATAREALEDGASDVFVSVVSGWEIDRAARQAPAVASRFSP